MSKIRKKQQSIRPKSKIRRAQDQPPSVKWTRKEKLIATGAVIGFLVIMLAPYTYLSLLGHQKSIQRRVEQWRIEYDLSDSETQKLLDIELEFHRHEYLFSFRWDPTTPHIEAHRKELAELLGSEGPDHAVEAPTK